MLAFEDGANVLCLPAEEAEGSGLLSRIAAGWGP